MNNSSQTSSVEGQEQQLLKLESYANWMDAKFRIPFTSIRFGWDAIIGLVPAVGDFVAFFMSTWLIWQAYRCGASLTLVGRMSINIIVELLAGAIPIVGDVFDVYWRANQKNIQLLRKHLIKSDLSASPTNYTDGSHSNANFKEIKKPAPIWIWLVFFVTAIVTAVVVKIVFFPDLEISAKLWSE